MSPSKWQVELVHPVLPAHIVLDGLEHHTSQVRGLLAEHMDVVVRAVADGLIVVFHTAPCDCADLFDDGLNEVTHDYSPVMMDMI